MKVLVAVTIRSFPKKPLGCCRAIRLQSRRSNTTSRIPLELETRDPVSLNMLFQTRDTNKP